MLSAKNKIEHFGNKEEVTWGGSRTNSGRNSMFKEKKKAINLTLTERAIEVLTKKAEKKGCSRSDYVSMLLLSDGKIP